MTSFWLTITRSTQATDARTYTLSLFDRPPTDGEEPIHRLTRPSHWPLSLQARQQVDAGQDTMQTYGNALARWLFCEQADPTRFNPIGERLREAAGWLNEPQRLRLLVCLEPSILDTPEFQQNGFLQSISVNTILPLEAVRSVVEDDAGHRLSHASPRPPVADQLRVLVVLSNPEERRENTEAGFEHLPSLEEDFTALIASLQPLQKHHAIFLQDLCQPSGAMLEARLQHVNPHVFVFLGHGYHHGSGSGLVCVEQGLAREWGYDRLQHILATPQEGSDLRVVVLVACRSFVAAPGCLSLGIPAVVGMQKYSSHDFPSAAVAPFAVPFFTAVADFAPITRAFRGGVEGLRKTAWQTEALDQARQAAQAHGAEGSTWLTIQERWLKAAAVMPTLWLSDSEDQLFAESERRLRASYCTALSSKLATCEWSGRPAHIPLMRAFVPPPLLDTGTGQGVDLDTALSKNGALVLQGPEWSGKTTVAHWWVLSTFHRNHMTPILVNLREMVRSNQSLEQWLVDSCQRWLGLNSAESVAHLIMEDCRKGKAVFVIDDMEHRWVAQPPSVLRCRLFGEQGQGIDMTAPILVTSKEWEQACHPEWACLLIQSLGQEQQRTVAQRYGEVLDVVPATRDFLQRITTAYERPDGVTPLAGRSGFWAEILAQFLRQMVLLTDESDLLDRLQQSRWRKPVESAKMIQPDEPVYKQRMLDELGFHLYFCRRGTVSGVDDEPIFQTVLRSVLQQMDLGEGPIYSPDVAARLLQEHVEIRPVLQRTASAGWAFRSAEWMRFYAASRLAALVNDQDPAVLAWIEGGKSLQCRSCEMNLGTFNQHVTPGRVDQILAAITAVKVEDLPAWRRTDPWDCPAVRDLRRVLVRALPLHPVGMTVVR